MQPVLTSFSTDSKTVPHEEYIDKDLAKARLLMPLKITRLEQRVEDIEKDLSKLSNNVSDLVSVLKTILVSKAPNNSTSQQIDDQMYIS